MRETETRSALGGLARLGGVGLFALLTFAACALNAVTAPPGPAPLEERAGFFAVLGFLVAIVASVVALLMRLVLGRAARVADLHHADDRN